MLNDREKQIIGFIKKNGQNSSKKIFDRGRISPLVMHSISINMNDIPITLFRPNHLEFSESKKNIPLFLYHK